MPILYHIFKIFLLVRNNTKMLYPINNCPDHQYGSSEYMLSSLFHIGLNTTAGPYFQPKPQQYFHSFKSTLKPGQVYIYSKHSNRNTKVIGGRKAKNENPPLKPHSQTQHVLFLCHFMNHQYHKNHKNATYRCSSTKLPSEQNERTLFR